MNLEDWYYSVSMLGSIATAISLIYLFIKDYKKSKKISQLEIVAETLKKELELRYQPHLWINDVQLRNSENRINIDLNNKREWCKLTDLKIISGDLEFDKNSLHLPYELEPKFDEAIISATNRRYLFLINSSNRNLSDVNYLFEIHYEDRLENKYKVNVSGKGAKVKLSKPQVIL